MLSLAIFIPISGWIADRFGARNVICTASGLFAADPVLCSLATSLPMLVGLRILQGLGGAMMNPVGRLILFHAFPRSELIRAMSWVAVPSVVWPCARPLLAGSRLSDVETVAGKSGHPPSRSWGRCTPN